MKKTFLSLLAAASIVSATPFTYTFDDVYGGQNPGTAANNGDVVGALRRFDIQKVTVSGDGGAVFISIFMNYGQEGGDTALGGIAIGSFPVLNPGDIMISSGANKWAVPLISHNDSVPAIGSMAAGNLYSVNSFLTAAQVPGPYVLVGGSMGGLFTRLYAATYPDEVAGMVLSDTTFEEVYALQALLLTPEDADAAMQLDLEGGDEEGIWTTESLPITFAQLREARKVGLKPMPLVVLAAGNFDADVGPDSPYPLASNTIWPMESLLMQATLATLTPDAKFIVVTESGHLIHEEQPQAVIDAVTDVVDAVRDPSTWQDAAAS